MKFPKAILLLSITCIALILVGGCIPQEPPSPEEILEDPDKAIANCEKAPEADREGCYYDIAFVLSEAGLVDKAMEICETMESDDCYWDLAMQANNIDACKLISESKRKDDCLRDLAGQDNVEACEELSKQFDRDECFFNVARQTESIEACGEISDVSTKDNCYNEMADRFKSTDLNKAFESCEKMTKKDDCYWNLMNNLKATDPDAALTTCSKLSISVDDCYNEVARSLIATDLNKAIYICGTMEYTTRKNNCYNEIATTPEITLANPDKAIEICGKKSIDVNPCYEDVARILTDTDKVNAKEACSHITDYDWERQCKRTYG